MGKKSAFLGQKQCFLGKKCSITWFILHISLSKFCKFAITRKNDAFDANIVNTRLTKIFIAIFAPDERLPSSATLLSSTTITIIADMADWNVLFFQKLNHLSLEAMDCHSVMLQTVAKDTGRHMF